MFWQPKTTRRVHTTLALLVPRDRSILVVQDFDRVTPQSFWRPLGGPIVFGVHSETAVADRGQEQTGFAIADVRFVATLESLYKLHRRRQHEVMILFSGRFADPAAYEKEEFLVRIEGEDAAKARWVDIHDPPEDMLLMPTGLREIVLHHWDKVVQP